MIMAVIKTL